MIKSWFKVLNTDLDLLNSSKREYRRKHFISWLSRKLFLISVFAFFIYIGYALGAGILDTSEIRTELYMLLDDDSGMFISDPDPDETDGMEPLYWGTRTFLECHYVGFNGPYVRRYWLGYDIESSMELSRLERLEINDAFQRNYRMGFVTLDPRTTICPPTAIHDGLSAY